MKILRKAAFFSTAGTGTSSRRTVVPAMMRLQSSCGLSACTSLGLVRVCSLTISSVDS